VVTGASDGIGKEIALRYSQRPSFLVLAARSEEKLAQVAMQCKENGCERCIHVPVDVSKEDDCRKLIQIAIQEFQRVDILVLCAGVSYHNTFELSNLSAFRNMMDVNFFGYLYCTYFALPYLKQAKRQIIVMSSVSGELGLPLRTGYCASKFAVNGFFEALKMELSDVHITMVMPSSVNTNMRNNSLDSGENKVQFHEAEHKRVPVKDCVDIVLDAADNRRDKVIFPLSNHVAILLKPWMPSIISALIKKKAGGQVLSVEETKNSSLVSKL